MVIVIDVRHEQHKHVIWDNLIIVDSNKLSVTLYCGNFFIDDSLCDCGRRRHIIQHILYRQKASVNTNILKKSSHSCKL